MELNEIQTAETSSPKSEKYSKSRKSPRKSKVSAFCDHPYLGEFHSYRHLKEAVIGAIP
jgi:hypothetical protein